MADHTLSPFDCSIILCVRDRPDLTAQCLVALSEATPDVRHELVIVEDGASDDTRQLCAALEGDVQVLRNERAMGLAAARNAGARAARGRHLVFLEEALAPLAGWLRALVDELDEHPEVAVAGSKVLCAGGTVEHAGVVFSREHRLPYWVHRGASAGAPEVSRRRELNAVSGCLAVRREDHEALGGFDEAFTDGYDDLELCLRARARGRRVVLVPGSHLLALERSRLAPAGEEARRSLLAARCQGRLLGDEDAFFVEDGHAMIYRNLRGEVRSVLQRLATAGERERWQAVAAVQTLASENKVDEARAWLARPDAWPAEPSALRWGGIACLWAGEPERARTFWERALALEEDPELRLFVARTLLERGEEVHAERHVDALLIHSPALGEAWFLRGVLLLWRSDPGAALTAFESALLNGADPRKALTGQGIASFLAGDPASAWDVLCAVLAEHPDDEKALHWLLQAGTALEWWDELAAELGEILRQAPMHHGARFALASVHVRRGDGEAARRERDRLRAAAPEHIGLAALDEALP